MGFNSLPLFAVKEDFADSTIAQAMAARSKGWLLLEAEE